MIKAFNEDSYCPMKLKKVFVDRTHDIIPSESMDRGNYFETLCLGSGAQGKVILDLPRKQNGDKTIAQERIELQAMEFPRVLASHRMAIKDKQVLMEHELEPGIVLFGTADMITSIWDDTDGPLPEVIVDLKLTMNIYSQFGPYCWHFPHNMDHTQAFMYSYLYWRKTGHRVPFYYLVFDYKPNPEYKIIKKLVGQLEYYELKESIRKTIERINHHEQVGYYTKPIEKNCKNCPLNTQCLDVTRAKKIQTV